MAVTNQDGANLTGQTIKSFDEFDDEGTKPTTKSKYTHEGTGDQAWTLNDIESEDIPLYNYGIRWRRYGEYRSLSKRAFKYICALIRFICLTVKVIHLPIRSCNAWRNW